MIDRLRSSFLRIASASALIALRSGVEPVEPWLSRLQAPTACRTGAAA